MDPSHWHLQQYLPSDLCWHQCCRKGLRSKCTLSPSYMSNCAPDRRASWHYWVDRYFFCERFIVTTTSFDGWYNFFSAGSHHSKGMGTTLEPHCSHMGALWKSISCHWHLLSQAVTLFSSTRQLGSLGQDAVSAHSMAVNRCVYLVLLQPNPGEHSGFKGITLAFL